MVPSSTTDTEAQRPPGARLGAAARVPQLIARQPIAFVGALLLVVGVGLLAFVAKVLDLGNGSILVIAFLGPLLAYLILTGQLSEIGAGGLNLKFREAARKAVDASVQLVTAEATQTIEKLGVEQMRRIDALDPEAPVVLTLTLGPRRGEYVLVALQQYVYQLGRHPRFRFVVFLDHDVESSVIYLAKFWPVSSRLRQRQNPSWRPSMPVAFRATEAFAPSSSRLKRRPRKPSRR
jgi:hypothetical protein